MSRYWKASRRFAVLAGKAVSSAPKEPPFPLLPPSLLLLSGGRSIQTISLSEKYKYINVNVL